MRISHVLAAGALALALTAPAVAGGRDTARIIKGLGMQSNNQKVQDALAVLESEGFLNRVGEALNEEGAASQTAQGLSEVVESDGPPEGSPATVAAASATNAPAAPGGIGEDAAKAKGVEACLPLIRKHLANPSAHVPSTLVWVKKTTTWGGKSIYKVTMMPESLGVVVYVHYKAEIDASTGEVISAK